MKLLVISDTHGEMPLNINKIDFDVMIHAGDIGNPAFFREIDSAIGEKNMLAVYGNTDSVLCEYLPETVSTEIGGTKFFIVHNLTAPHRILSSNESAIKSNRSEIVVFGHTHIPAVEERGGILFVNPGSLGKSGLTCHRSFSTVEIDETGNVSAKIFDVDSSELLISKKFNKVNSLFVEI
ncbi:metallophosphoesterase family protein [bacterium]|nr:metallophosphoesterase family protein [bacterium]